MFLHLFSGCKSLLILCAHSHINCAILLIHLPTLPIDKISQSSYIFNGVYILSASFPDDKLDVCQQTAAALSCSEKPHRELSCSTLVTMAQLRKWSVDADFMGWYFCTEKKKKKCMDGIKSSTQGTTYIAPGKVA